MTTIGSLNSKIAPAAYSTRETGASNFLSLSVHNVYKKNTALLNGLTAVSLSSICLEMANQYQWINLGGKLPAVMGIGYSAAIALSFLEAGEAYYQLKSGDLDEMHCKLYFLKLISNTAFLAWSFFKIGSFFLVGAVPALIAADLLLLISFFSALGITYYNLQIDAVKQ